MCLDTIHLPNNLNQGSYDAIHIKSVNKANTVQISIHCQDASSDCLSKYSGPSCDTLFESQLCMLQGNVSAPWYEMYSRLFCATAQHHLPVRWMLTKDDFNHNKTRIFQGKLQGLKRLCSAPYNALECHWDWRRTSAWPRPPRPGAHAHLNSALFSPFHLSGSNLETARLKIAPVHWVVLWI